MMWCETNTLHELQRTGEDDEGERVREHADNENSHEPDKIVDLKVMHVLPDARGCLQVEAQSISKHVCLLYTV